jgi:hypothetical protein
MLHKPKHKTLNDKPNCCKQILCHEDKPRKEEQEDMAIARKRLSKRAPVARYASNNGRTVGSNVFYAVCTKAI